MLFVGAKHDAVGVEIFAVARDHALRIGMVEAAHGEVDSAFAVGGDVVHHDANAIQRIAVDQLVRQGLALGSKLLNRRVHSAVDRKQSAFRVHSDGAAGVQTHVRDGIFAVLVQLDHLAVVVLRDEETAVTGADNAVGVIALDGPDLFPFLPRGDYARDLRDGVISGEGLRGSACSTAWSALSSATTAAGSTLRSAAASRLGGRSLAGLQYIRLLGIGRRLHA